MAACRDLDNANHTPVTRTNCEIVEVAEKIESARHADPIRYHPMVQRHLCVSTLDNSFVERRTCSPRRITFTTQALTKLPGPTRSGPPCRLRFRADAYQRIGGRYAGKGTPELEDH